MQIRTRLTLQFLFIGGAIMIIASCAIYFSSATYRRDDFFRRLENKSTNTAKILVEIDEIDAELLRRIEKDNPINFPDEKIIILNYKNDTLYTSDEGGDIRIDEDILSQIRLTGKIHYRQKPYDVLGYLFTEKYDRFVVIAAATDPLGLLKMRNLRIILIVVCLTSLLLFFIAGWVYSGKALEPISSVIRSVEEVSINSLNLRVDEGNGTDEIARLARTFNNMLSRLEDAFSLQKDFISNASHEIRTPLTSIYGQLQVLLLKDRKKIDYKSTITSVLEDIRNLSDLSNNLLLLARASSGITDKSVDYIRMDEILWQIAEDIKKLNKEFAVNIKIGLDSATGDAEQMMVLGNESLLRTAVLNIVENSCKYSDDHAADVLLDCVDNKVTMTFTDRGKGIPPEDLDKIFEPFYRGNNSKTIPGHGIGLSLVQKIIQNHKGTITISSDYIVGTKVIVELPLAHYSEPSPGF
jgi:signal transduction histidine kinase